jgi:hypothetical protein
MWRGHRSMWRRCAGGGIGLWPRSRRRPWPQRRQGWEQALQGTRQVVLVTGEAGIGKTTLVDAWVAQVVATDDVWVGRGQCIEQYGAGEAYLPLFEILGQIGHWSHGARLEAGYGPQAREMGLY